MDSDVVKFFDNKTIFLTGASGFVGKLLLHKLLRDCPGIKAIYVLIRPAKEKTAVERLEQIFDNAIFDQIKSENPDFNNKVHVIPGDIRFKDLAVTRSDRKKLIQNVNIVLHTAATVAFTSTLKEAVLTNVNGTKELLDMCEEMQELEVAMVMSTAYSHCVEFNIGEYFMNSPMKPDTILRMLEELDEKQFNKMEKNLLQTRYHNFPNNYVFTKAISEEVVKEKHGKIPVGLVRPSIILPTYTDPLRNWADNFYGSVGLATIMALGVMHVFFSKKNCKIDQVPADYCVNAFITATYDTFKKYQKEKQPLDIVYNNTGNEYSINVKQLVDYGKQFYTVPLDKAVWPVSVRQTSCVYDYWLFSILLHFIPALLADFVRLFWLKKPKFFKMYMKIEKMNQLFGYFTTSEWNMMNDNMMKAYHDLSETDKKLFPFDISTIDWADYYRDSSLSVKKYLFKEKMDPESVEKSRKRYARLEIYHKIFLAAMYSLSVFVIWKIVHMFSACVNRHFYN